MSRPKLVKTPNNVNNNTPKQAKPPSIPKHINANNIIIKLINVIKENL